ncbi:hypothetical protein GCM10016272_04440 [Psychrobacter glaciei]|uniref:Uncharacterized protein n=1 Tax=Psychrobacter glaciei TaxID=619771 RepID=A0ABQ3GP89_9GAMM|nr:hypothetical protein GCM10016272_04440 [Psychrobacter glaciei]
MGSDKFFVIAGDGIILAQSRKAKKRRESLVMIGNMMIDSIKAKCKKNQQVFILND